MDPCASPKVGSRLTELLHRAQPPTPNTQTACRTHTTRFSSQGQSHAHGGQVVPGWKRPGLHSTASLWPKISQGGKNNQVRQFEANSTAKTLPCAEEGSTGKCTQRAWTHTWDSHLVCKQGISVSLLSWLPQKEQGLEFWGEG